MATEKAPLPQRKTRSSNKKAISIERYEYLAKIEGEYTEVWRSYRKHDALLKNAIEENLELKDEKLKLLEELTFFREMNREQVSYIIQ